MLVRIGDKVWTGKLQHCLIGVKKEIEGCSYGHDNTLYLDCSGEKEEIINSKGFGELEDICWLLAGFRVNNKLNVEVIGSEGEVKIIKDEINNQLEEYYG